MCVALDIQHAKRMRHIILLSDLCLAIPHFFTLSHEWHNFREKNSSFSTTLSETFHIIRRIKRDTIIDVGLHMRYELFLPGFNET